MKIISSFIVLYLALGAVPASAQNIDCSVIRDNPASYNRCVQGQKEAKAAQREKERQMAREARIRETMALTKKVGAACVKSKAKCAKEALRPTKAE